MYAAVFTWLDDHKRLIIITVACVIVLGAAFMAGYFAGCRTAVPDNGAGADAVRNQLNQAAGNQSAITSGLSDATGTAADVTAGIDRGQAEVGAAGATVKRIEAGQSEAAGLISDSQQILANIRARGKTNTIAR